MCPSALIENWHDEFLEWVPGDDKTVGNLGQIRKIETSTTQALSQRLAEIDAWYTRGGILLISYTIFKNTVLNNAGPKRPAPLTPDRHVVVRKQLLEGPNIIVADEAHTMKNPKTKVADATRAFVSKSRIALTGSPLANNLTDYYAMIDWIAPGYLGSFKQFQANYVEPIQEGLYADSTSAERRKSLKKLQVLKEDLDPKINRHDITALKGDLPPKVEFVITIPLTDLQKRAYELYLSTIFGGEDASNARLWDWLAILSLCCAHPSCFMAKLVARNESSKKTRQPKITDSESEAVSPAEDLPSPASDEEPALPIEDVTEDVAPQSVSETVMAELQRLFNAVPDQDCPSLSHRVQILNQIVRRSIKAGDKVLVFSHSLPSLSYIERLLTKQGIKHCRLDGQMRAGLRQNAVKQFNTRDDLDVFLISTRAGGQGLNIYGANRVILFDFQFNPSWEEQAIGRAYRLGQKKDVFVYRFIAGGTFESAVHNRTLYKMQLASRVVDKKNPIRRASRNNTQYLRAPKEVEQIDLSEFKGKDSVLDAILAKGLPIRKIELDETFQREDGDKLTAEELKDVQEELQLEQLKRNNPVEWARQESIREAEKRKMEIEREERYRHWHNTSTQAAPNGVPSQPQPRNPPPPPFSYAPGGPAGQAMRLAFPPQHPPVPPNYFHGHPMSMNPQPPYFANPPPLPPDRRLLADGSAPPPSSAPSSTVFGNNDALFGTQSPAIPASVNQTPATPQAQQQQAPETVSEGHQAKELPETRDVNMGDVEHTLPQTTTAEASSNTEIQSDSAEDKVVEKPTDKQADKPPEGADIEMTGVDGDQPRRNETGTSASCKPQ
jgi:superfamily II DNA/RNA helicase